MDLFVAFINLAIISGIGILFGTLGEILTQKSGNINLGVEGMMFMGAVSGLAGVILIEQAIGTSLNPVLAVIVAIVASFLAGAFGAFIYSVIVISMRAQQNVTGIALTIFGAGVGNFFGPLLGRVPGGGAVTVSREALLGFRPLNIPVLSDIPVLGPLLFNYNILIYLAIALAIMISIFLNRTRTGLNLRAVGENPATADAAGINVTKYKYLATCIGGGICGIGGMYFSMVIFNGIWVHQAVQSWGWIAVALVIFSTWNPLRAIVGALIFGGLQIVNVYLPAGHGIPTQFFVALPFIVTILVLIVTSLRRIKEHSPPGHLGQSYFREER